MMSIHRRVALAATAAVLAASLSAADATAQSLRGSRTSVERMYREARAEHLSFFETPKGVRRAVAARRLVRLEPDSELALHKVGYPFVRPATRTFAERLGTQYLAACGEPLVVTSAVRPATRQPANSTSRSVHPTGMAIDLRKPDDPECRSWLRTTLLELEDDGLLEATEEFAPPHFHVAVFPKPYARYAAARVKAERRMALAARTSTYTVRAGDTLWEIARAHDTTVDAIAKANDLGGVTIRPGQELRIPSGG